jgi:hypothetical protein
MQKSFDTNAKLFRVLFAINKGDLSRVKSKTLKNAGSPGAVAKAKTIVHIVSQKSTGNESDPFDPNDRMIDASIDVIVVKVALDLITIVL